MLLISVDGLHQSDVEWYVSNHPGSELAKLVGGGAEYARAQTPIPSDSFPGMTAQVTGGNPRTTGVYYDDEYSHAVLPAGTTSCHGQPTGGEVIYDSPDDKDATALDAGQGLAGLPGSILEMTAQPQSLLNPAALPVNPQTCKPIYPHEYLKVNTIFEVAHAHGLRTAWSDKHPAYEALDGPVGQRHRRPVHARDRQQRARTGRQPVPGRNQLDRRQRGDDAVRLLQGPGGAQRDRRLRPQPHDARSACRRSSG